MLRFTHNGGHLAMRTRITRVKKGFRPRMGEAVFNALGPEEQEAKTLTPVLTGALQGTVRRVGPVETSTGVTAYLAAGDENVDYAIYVHEDPDAYHPTGQWKFIEQPLMESAPFMAQRIATEFNALGGYELI